MGFEQFIERACQQTAVYWGNPVADGYGGHCYDSPVEVKCRWEQKQELIMIQKGPSAHGEEIISTAQIYVLQDVEEGEYLYLGSLNELDSNPDNPKEVEDAFQIKKFEKTSVHHSTTKFIRKVYL